MVDKNDPLFREVDEELRREQWAKLWEQYGLYVIGAAAIIVTLVGGFKFWESRQRALAEAAGTQYEAAVDLARSGKAEAAAKALQDVAASGQTGYGALAELTLAGSFLKADKPQEALAVLEKLAGDTSGDELLASFAALQAAALRLGDADYAEMQNRLNPLARDEGPWRYNARELLGTAAVKAGKLDEARNVFAPLLADPKVPEGTLERVRRVMAAIAAAEVAKAGSAPASGTSGDADPPAGKAGAAPN